jgi:hypothetical protein
MLFTESEILDAPDGLYKVYAAYSGRTVFVVWSSTIGPGDEGWPCETVLSNIFQCATTVIDVMLVAKTTLEDHTGLAVKLMFDRVEASSYLCTTLLRPAVSWALRSPGVELLLEWP